MRSLLALPSPLPYTDASAMAPQPLAGSVCLPNASASAKDSRISTARGASAFTGAVNGSRAHTRHIKWEMGAESLERALAALDALEASTEQHCVVAAQDHGPAKRYGVLTLAELRQTLCIDAGLYEMLLEGTALKLYLDIEFSNADYPQGVVVNAALAAVDAGAAACGLRATGVSILTASGADADRLGGKASFHLIFRLVNADDREVFFPSAPAVQAWVERNIQPAMDAAGIVGRKYDLTGPAPVVGPRGIHRAVDPDVYGRTQCFRAANQSKGGNGKRPLVPFAGPVEMPSGMEALRGIVLVSYLGRNPLFIDAKHTSVAGAKGGRAPKRPRAEAAAPATGVKRRQTGPAVPSPDVLARAVANPAAEAIAARLLPLLRRECYTDNTLACKLAWWCIKQSDSEAMVDLLVAAFAPHAGTERGTRGWIESKCEHGRRRARSGDPTISQAFALQQVAVAHHEEAVSLGEQLALCRSPAPAALSPLVDANETYNERWVRALPADEATLAVWASMGMGKTTAFEVWLQEKISASPDIRVLVLSCRRSLTGHFESALRPIAGFSSYLADDWAPIDQFTIVQVESLHRLDYARDLVSVDVIVLDECEGVFAQLTSLDTHGHNLTANHRVFERLVSEAKQVIAMDALLTTRTTDALRLLRPSARVFVTRNTYQPITRAAIELAPYKVTDDRGRVHVFVNTRGLIEKMAVDLESGRRCVFVTSSKVIGDEAMASLTRRFPSKKIGFWSGDSTEAMRTELKDVNKHWSKYDAVMYTSTVAVGVSYSALPHFDCLYAYFTAGSVCVRECMQMLRRVRHFSVNCLVFVVQPKCLPPLTSNRMDTDTWLQLRMDLAERKLPSHDASPEWLREVYTHNVTEVNESRSKFRRLLLAALVHEGHTLSVQEYTPKDLDAVEEAPCHWPLYDDVKNISEHQAECIEALRRTGSPDLEQRLQAKKYALRRAFRDDAPKDIIVAEWSMWCEYGGEARFWRIVRERTMTLTQAKLAEARGHTALTATSHYHQREALDMVLRILGMAHSHELKTVDASAFAALLPSLHRAEADVIVHLGIRPSDREDKGVFNACNALDLLQAVFERWGVNIVKANEQRRKVNGVKRRTYGIKIGDDETGAFWRALSIRAVTA